MGRKKMIYLGLMISAGGAFIVDRVFLGEPKPAAGASSRSAKKTRRVTRTKRPSQKEPASAADPSLTWLNRLEEQKGQRDVFSPSLDMLKYYKVLQSLTAEDGEVVLEFDHYDSRIQARVSEDGARLDGEWIKRRGPDQWTKMAFHAVAGAEPRFPLSPSKPPTPLAPRFDGRWAVKFSKSEDPAVGVFVTHYPGFALGTFLTTTGDYRYLAGNWDETQMQLSCFDGAHAFLFHGRRSEGGDGQMRPEPC